MRIDLLLKALCLVKTRSRGQAGCEAGAVLLNGAAAKPSRAVRAGDIVEIRRGGKALVIEILEVPQRPPSKKDAPACYRVISEAWIETPGTGGGGPERP